MLRVQPKALGLCSSPTAASGPGYCWENEESIRRMEKSVSAKNQMFIFMPPQMALRSEHQSSLLPF